MSFRTCWAYVVNESFDLDINSCGWWQSFDCDFDYKLDYKQDRGIERRLNMLLMSTFLWIIIGVAVVILAVFIGVKIKDRYFQKSKGFSLGFQFENVRQSACLFGVTCYQNFLVNVKVMRQHLQQENILQKPHFREQYSQE